MIEETDVLRYVRSPAQFSLGNIGFTPAALKELWWAGQEGIMLLARHACGDWGELPSNLRERMNHALVVGEEVCSCYRLTTGTVVWIATQADRASTTVHLPSDPEHSEIKANVSIRLVCKLVKVPKHSRRRK